MPIYALWCTATKSDAAGTVFQVCLALNLGFVANASQQTTSRLLWAFGRDNGLILSKQLYHSTNCVICHSLYLVAFTQAFTLDIAGKSYLQAPRRPRMDCKYYRGHHCHHSSRVL